MLFILLETQQRRRYAVQNSQWGLQKLPWQQGGELLYYFPHRPQINPFGVDFLQWSSHVGLSSVHVSHQCWMTPIAPNTTRNVKQPIRNFLKVPMTITSNIIGR